MSENIGKCKDCKWFGQYLINDEDLDIDWCFNPNKEGAVATLWSCEDWEEKDHFHSGKTCCNAEEYLKTDAIMENRDLISTYEAIKNACESSYNGVSTISTEVLEDVLFIFDDLKGALDKFMKEVNS